MVNTRSTRSSSSRGPLSPSPPPPILRPRKQRRSFKVKPMTKRWSELPFDTLINVAERMSSFDDFYAMRRVCRHWRLGIRAARYSGTAPQVPWLILPGEEDNAFPLAKVRTVYRLSGDDSGGERFMRFKLPEETRGSRCVSSMGWILVVPEYDPMSLFNPFSEQRIDIPDMDRSERDTSVNIPFLHKFVMSASPSLTDEYWIVIVYGVHSNLAVWRPGWSSWRRMEDEYDSEIMDVAFYNGKFYAISADHDILSYTPRKENQIGEDDDGDDYDELEFMMKVNVHFPDVLVSMFYLVEVDGKLVLVGRGSSVSRESWVNYKTYKFWLREIVISGEELPKVVSLKSLGNKALFLGDNQSFSIEASKTNRCEENCVYFTDNVWLNWDPTCTNGGGNDIGVYRRSSRRVDSCYDGRKTISKINPAMWIEPRC